MKYTFKTFGIALISSTLLCFVLILLGRPSLASAYSAVEIEARVPDARNKIINGMETPCFNDLVNENGIDRRGGDTERDNVNDSNPYRDHEWISPQGIPSKTSITVPAGTSTVNMQLNKMLFICAALVESNSSKPSDIDDGSSIVTFGPPTNFANDRKPNPTSMSPTTHIASLTGVNTRVNSASVVSASGGTVNVGPGSTLPIPRDNNSRYWFAGPLAFTYDAGGPMVSPRTVKIRFNFSHIRSYGGVHQCAKPGGGPPVSVGSNTNFAPCATGDTEIEFYIIVDGAPVGVHDSTNCDLSQFLKGWAFDPDSPSTSIQVHIYVNAPATDPATIGPGPGAQGTGQADKQSDGGTSPPTDVNGTYGISGQHRFSIPFSALNAAQQTALNAPGSHNVYIYAIGINSSGTVDGSALLSGSPKAYDPGNCIPPTTFSCSNIGTNPSPVGVNSNFSLGFSISVTGGPAGTNYTYTATLVPNAGNPSLINGNKVITGTISNGSSPLSASFPGPPPAPGLTVSQPGVYNGDINIVFSGGGSATCAFSGNPSGGPCAASCGFIAATQPYFRVYNGDVISGASGACPGWTTAATLPGTLGALKAWNDGTGRGAGTQLADFALDNINGFTSASGRTSSPVPSRGLSFANTGPGVGTFGGSFTTGNSCPPDYFATLPAGANPIVGSVPGVSGYYAQTAAGTLTFGGGTVLNGQKVAMYVNGDVYITNSVTYAGAGGWTDPSQIPSFYMIVKGNIYIHPTVTELSGVYVAQPDSSGKGRIYSCALGFNPPNPAQINNVCKNNKLSIFGALVARTLGLYRSIGDLGAGSNGEGSGSGNIAEAITFSPDAWLTTPAPFSSTSTQADDYDAITSLPPVL